MEEETKKNDKEKRGKIEMKKVENAKKRRVSFTKRRSGLIKKAHELSIRCDAHIGVIVFSKTGNLYECFDLRMDQLIDRYLQTKGLPLPVPAPSNNRTIL